MGSVAGHPLSEKDGQHPTVTSTEVRLGRVASEVLANKTVTRVTTISVLFSTSYLAGHVHLELVLGRPCTAGCVS